MNRSYVPGDIVYWNDPFGKSRTGTVTAKVVEGTDIPVTYIENNANFYCRILQSEVTAVVDTAPVDPYADTDELPVVKLENRRPWWKIW